MTFRLWPAGAGQGTGVQADITPPLSPVGGNLSNYQANSVLVSWSSNSEPDLDEYRVYKSTDGPSSGFSFLASTPGTSYEDGTYDPSIQQWYKLSAVDLVGNESSLSSAITDDDAPGAPSAPTLNTQGSTTLTINLPASDAIDHASYEVWVGLAGQSLSQNAAGVTGSTYQITSLDTDTSYDIALKDVDVSGNVGSLGAALTASTSSASGLSYSVNLQALTHNAHTLNFEALVNGGVASYDAYADVEYRITGAGTWSNGLRMFRVRPEFASITRQEGWCGSIFGLTPGNTYDIRITVVDGAASETFTLSSISTASLPAASGSANKTATTSDAQTVLNGAVAGDVIELQAGTYGSLTVSASGTSGNPIVVKGADRDAVIVSWSGTTLSDEGIAVSGDHVILEYMTFDGPDAGNSAGVNYAEATLTGNVIRHCKFQNTRRGVKMWGGSSSLTSFLIYDNTFEGPYSWAGIVSEVEAGGYDAVSFDYSGLYVTGVGHSIFNNTFQGWSDCLKLRRHVGNGSLLNTAELEFYHNDLLFCADDAAELDDGIRNISCYENRFLNCGTAVSIQPTNIDGGGPFNVIKNVMVNSWVRAPFKANDGAHGWRWLNNTIVQTETSRASVTGDYGWLQAGNGTDVRNGQMLNNLVLTPNTANVINSEANRDYTLVEWDYNGYFPDGQFSFDGTTETNLAAATAGGISTWPDGYNGGRHPNSTAFEANGQVLGENPTSITIGADWTTQVSAQSAELDSAIGGGLNLSNVSNGTDLGAVQFGGTEPTYGDRTDNTALKLAFDDLSAGEDADFSAGDVPNSLWRISDATSRTITSWTERGHWSDSLKQAIILGKGVGGEDAEMAEWDDGAAEWTNVDASALLSNTETGHIYDGADIVDATGEMWCLRWLADLFQYTPGSGWSEYTSADPGISSVHNEASFTAGLAYHPNLFGAGQAGLVICGKEHISAIDLSDGTHTDLTDQVASFNNGLEPCAFYSPDLDAVFCGGGRDSNTIYRVVGGATPALTVRGTAPGAWAATEGDDYMIPSPYEDGTLYYLRRNGDLYSSTDEAANWTQESDHPFATVAGGSDWFPIVVTTYDGVWVLYNKSPQDSSDSGSHIWKPPVA